MMNWQNLLSEKRFSHVYGINRDSKKTEESLDDNQQFRTPIERDHDRILFSSPFRRMGDKTQVFPLESIESIRSRLTHSYEVANLARSIGLQIATDLAIECPNKAIRNIPAALAASGLAHDIGNPPFGHEGEQAIRSWFKRNKQILFNRNKQNFCESKIDVSKLSKQHKNDFLKFEGNAQTLRVLTKLQTTGDDLGLNLTMCTIASSMKYVVGSDQINNEQQARKKHGYFASEEGLVETVRNEVGLEDYARHPLALVLEACDDIAYSVLDAEDLVKKDLASFNDLLAWLKNYCNGAGSNDCLIKKLCSVSKDNYKQLVEQNLLPSERNDVAMQKLRTHAIHIMVVAVVKAFKEKYNEICSGTFDNELIQVSEASSLCRALKKFDRENAFNHRSVLELELGGYNTINRLMDLLWIGITERENFKDVESRRRTPFARYVYSRISKNYRRVFEGDLERHHSKCELPIRYREMQLLTDMVSGMTDRFCIDLDNDLTKYHMKMSTVDGTSC